MNEQKPKQKARIVSVTQTINGIIKCSVQMGHAGGVRNNVPVSKPNAKAMLKPETGDTAIVDYTEDGSTYIADVLSVPSKEYEAPTLAEGSMTFQFDDSTEITVDKNDSGDYIVDINASGKVSVNATNVDVTASQTATIDANTVKLGGSNGTKVVARKGDTVETTDPLTGTNTGEITSGATNTEAK